MEEVDKLILQSVRLFNPDLDENIQSLGDLTTEGFISTIVACLRSIIDHESRSGGENMKVSSEMLSEIKSTLPPSMTARYRMCSQLAESIQSIGYRGDVGYQSLLYGLESERRRLLMYLVERLPKDPDKSSSAVSAAVTLNYRTEVLNKVRDRIRSQLAEPSIPVQFIVKDIKGDFEYYPFSSDRLSFSPSNSSRLHIPFSLQAGGSNGILTPLAVDFCDILVNVVGTGDSFSWENNSCSEVEADDLLVSRCLGLPSGAAKGVRPKPALKPKPKNLISKENLNLKNSSGPVANAPIQLTAEIVPMIGTQNFETQEQLIGDEVQEVTYEVLEQDLVQLKSELSKVDTFVRQTATELTRVVQESKSFTEKLQAVSTEVKSKKKMARALVDVDESIKRLEEYLQESDNRQVRAEKVWEDARQPLVSQLLELRAVRPNRTETERLAEETDKMSEKLAELGNESVMKERIMAQLKKSLARMDSGGAKRGAYTKRILDMVASIAKQQEVIGKVIKDITVVQKEINTWTGRLERTFVAAEELLFRDASRDESVRKAYKSMVGMHEKFSEIRTAIEKERQISGDVKTLEDQIESYAQESFDVNLEALLQDYHAVQRENQALKSQLSSIVS